MSKFSGKCDLYDVLISIKEMDDKSDWSKIKIKKYINELDSDGWYKTIDLEINNKKDLVPYYNFIEYAGSDYNGNFSALIGLHSFVYTEEQEFLNRILKNAKREYRKSLRKKEPFIPEEVAKKISLFGRIDDNTLEICERVKMHPYSAKLDGLHTNIHNYFREELMKEMIKEGYTKEQAYEWCYFERKTW